MPKAPDVPVRLLGRPLPNPRAGRSPWAVRGPRLRVPAGSPGPTVAGHLTQRSLWSTTVQAHGAGGVRSSFLEGPALRGRRTCPEPQKARPARLCPDPVLQGGSTTRRVGLSSAPRPSTDWAGHLRKAMAPTSGHWEGWRHEGQLRARPARSEEHSGAPPCCGPRGRAPSPLGVITRPVAGSCGAGDSCEAQGIFSPAT